MTTDTDTRTPPDTWSREDRWRIERALVREITSPAERASYGVERGTLYMKATAALHKLPGNAEPYFSLTGDVYKTGRERDPIACGAMGDEMVAHWPELDIVNRLHLSTWPSGEPMHALANGLYHLRANVGQYVNESPDYLAVAAEHLRISIEQAERLTYLLRPDPGTPAEWYTERLREWLAQNGVTLRWEQEAAEALAVIQG